MRAGWLLPASAWRTGGDEEGAWLEVYLASGYEPPFRSPLNIAERTTSGVDWGEDIWHRVRLERRLSDGSVRVWFDDMSEPIMEAHDLRFEWGMVGFGTFDDVGRIRNLVIRGAEVRPGLNPAF